MKSLIVLSHTQAALLIKARQEHYVFATISSDLGLSTLDVSLSSKGILFPSGEQLSWESIEQIATSDTKCFVITDREISEIKLFSDYTNRVYRLYPTSGAPTMLISGIPMHRIKGTDPYRDTLEKINPITPGAGCVLDTLSLAGELYSATFYSELYRVLQLQYRGRLIHYIGNLDSKSGSTTTKGVVHLLHKAGFSQVYPRPKAFGVVAIK